MNTLTTRIARLTAASALALSLGAGPASATYNSWAGEAPPDSSVAAEDDASPDGVGQPGGIRSAEDGASPDTIGRGGGIRSAEDGATPEWYL